MTTRKVGARTQSSSPQSSSPQSSSPQSSSPQSSSPQSSNDTLQAFIDDLADVNDWTLKELQQAARDLSVPPSGTKAQIRDRLVRELQELLNISDSSDFDDSDDSEPEPETDDSDDTTTWPLQSSLYVPQLPDNYSTAGCPPHRRPVNGRCTLSRPYLNVNSNGGLCCSSVPNATSQQLRPLRRDYIELVRTALTRNLLELPPGQLSPHQVSLAQNVASTCTTATATTKAQCTISPHHIQLIIYDLETTGLPYINKSTGQMVYPAITQIATYNVNQDKFFSTLVNPQRRISADAAEITGLTNARLAVEPTFAQVAPVLIDETTIVPEYSDKTFFVWVAHNGFRFDEPTLRANMARAGVAVPTNWVFVDSLHLALSWLVKDVPASKSLGTLYMRYVGRELADAHNAEADVMGLYRVLKGLFDEYYGRSDVAFMQRKLLEYVFWPELSNWQWLQATDLALP